MNILSGIFFVITSLSVLFVVSVYQIVSEAFGVGTPQKEFASRILR